MYSTCHECGGVSREVPTTRPKGGWVADRRPPAAADLVSFPGASGSPVRLHKDAAAALTRLRAEAARAGFGGNLLLPTSGYRDPARQQQLWDAALKKYGSPEAARRWVAPPGRSVHQTGKAVDLWLGTSNNSENVAALRQTGVWRWLSTNAARFGFLPYTAEPWHWEYAPERFAPAGLSAVAPRPGTPPAPAPVPGPAPAPVAAPVPGPAPAPAPVVAACAAVPSPWLGLLNSRPPVAVQRGLVTGGLYPQRVEAGGGDLNLDQYEVELSTPPILPGRGTRATATDLTLLLRQQFNRFLGPNWFQATPLPGHAAAWFGPNPVGAGLFLDFRLNGVQVPDNATVVVSDASPTHFTVHTWFAPTSGWHPISGARQWYVRSGSNGSLYLGTRAVDRISSYLLTAGTAGGLIAGGLPGAWGARVLTAQLVYWAQDQAWRAFQQNVAAFVNTNGGRARVLGPIARRVPWPAATACFRPAIPWVVPAPPTATPRDLVREAAWE